ncbi:MAG: adenylyl-sulfate kinase [Alphaproteobacteria bacterium]
MDLETKPPSSELPLIRVLTCGSVDDGKSTLIGRLLYDSKSLLIDQMESLSADSKLYGTAGAGELDFALLLDGLAAEREQGITIDVAYRFFATDHCHFIIADTPGHEQYTRNMATGASTADAAILLIDARSGLTTQTKRHAQILSLLGVKHIALAINKMDLIDFDEKIYDQIHDAFMTFAECLGIDQVTAIPLSARYGDNLFVNSNNTPWYQGDSLIDWLHSLPALCHIDRVQNHAFLMQVQTVNRPNLDFRGYTGIIAQGSVKCGDSLIIQPSNSPAKVKAIFNGDKAVNAAMAGAAITLTLDREIDISRGDLFSHADAPAPVSNQFMAQLIWFGAQPMLPERRYIFKFGTKQLGGMITQLKHRLDVNQGTKLAATTLNMNEIGTVNLSLDHQIAYHSYADNKRLGAFIVIDRMNNQTIGGGMIDYGLRRADNLTWQATSIDSAARASLKSQKPIALWFTGLSGAGKSTIADALEAKLYHGGHHTMLLDGDNVRHGLNRDLGFTDADRVENIRRVAEVTRLMLDGGLIALVAFISPFRAERQLARELMKDHDFWEIHIDSSLESCEARDVKGLYAKARKGEILNFTGISSAYEPPQNPEIHIDTASLSAGDAANLILQKLKKAGHLL